MSTGEFGSQHYESEFESVDEEIAKLAFACGVSILDPGVIERVIRGDLLVAAHPDEAAFRKLRGLLELHYELTIECVDAIGSAESRKILEHVRERLNRHFRLAMNSQAAQQ